MINKDGRHFPQPVGLSKRGRGKTLEGRKGIKRPRPQRQQNKSQSESIRFEFSNFSYQFLGTIQYSYLSITSRYSKHTNKLKNAESHIRISPNKVRS